jgi:hypothetical protein
MSNFNITKEETAKILGTKISRSRAKKIKPGTAIFEWNGNYHEHKVMPPFSQDGIYPTTLEDLSWALETMGFVLFKDVNGKMWRLSKKRR